MTNAVNIDGMTLGPGVIETIVSIAVNEVDGVASLGACSTSGMRSRLSAKPSTSGIAVVVGDDDRLYITLHIEVYSGYVLPEVADQVRTNVSEALGVQVGVEVAQIDIYVDGIQFPQ